MGGGTMNSAVDPAVAGNPSYTLLGTAGANTIVLTPSQIPSHTHTPTVNDPGHSHTYSNVAGTLYERGSSGSKFLKFPETAITSSSPTNISVSIGSTGGGLGHSNFQPGLGCYYIMYIP
jgi:microcystin-dependent protein